MSVQTGLEQIVKDIKRLKGAKVGLLCHQASIDSQYRHAKDIFHSLLGKGLRCLFSPQHGLHADKQDNMIESPDTLDAALKIPVFSLYGKWREPQDHMLSLIDTFVVDLQDCGTRVYTYIWTMLLSMMKCASKGIRFVVLDRPNPIGGRTIEGNLLKDAFYSFVGMAPIPMRHGMTIGELALYLKDLKKLDLELEIVPMQGWQRDMYFDATHLPWVWPSPNMPCLEAAVVYPGQVLLEGTNLSEGRGTTRPFEVFGAPFLDTNAIKKKITSTPLSGFVLREQSFEPTFHKWQGRTCRGFQLHVTNRSTFQPYLFTLTLLSIIMSEHPSHFAYRSPPYEYEMEILPMDLLIGDEHVRLLVEEGAGPDAIKEYFRSQERLFREVRRPYLLYPDSGK